MSPYWQNNSCSPFLGASGSCEAGNLASYAIDVRKPGDAIAGVNFARANNIRLTIKNTGHDFLGRSSGAGSLALWTHNLKDVEVIKKYKSPASPYRGHAIRIGAGMQNQDLYAAADANGYRAVGGSCPTVGASGGFSQAGGHGPLGARYGLGSDQVLEFEVVTAGGKLVMASPAENSGLYWALAGGGPGNLGVLLSVTVKVFPDGPVAGASFSFSNTNDGAFWSAIAAWLRHLVVLDAIPGFTSLWALTAQGFALQYATLPDANAAQIQAALAPFLQQVAALNLTLLSNETATNPSFLRHYSHFATQSYDTNNSIGGRIVSRGAVQTNLPALVDAMRDIVVNSQAVGGSQIAGIALNVGHARVGNEPSSNSVLPAWRDALFTMTIGIPLAQDADWSRISAGQRQLNVWQDHMRAVTPGGGSYMNEATFDNAHWKEDYFGANYQRLLSVKTRYDPDGTFWASAAVGSDAWKKGDQGRLCRV